MRKSTLKLYDKGERALRLEAIVHSVKELRCGKRLEKLSIVLAKLQRIVIDFLNVVHAAHLSTLDAGALDALPQPTRSGRQRLAGVDIHKPRMRAMTAAVLTLAAQPGGFTAVDLAKKTRAHLGPGAASRLRPAQTPGQGVGRARGHEPPLPRQDAPAFARSRPF